MTGGRGERWVTGWWPMPALTGLVAASALAGLALTSQARPVPLPTEVLLPTRPAVPAPALPSGRSPYPGTPAPVRSSAAVTQHPTVRVVPPSHAVVEAPDDGSARGTEDPGGEGG